jgi:hypothetical protein
MLGRFEASRIANWMFSSVQPLPVHSFRIASSSSSLTVLVSTTLYWRATRPSARAQRRAATLFAA